MPAPLGNDYAKKLKDKETKDKVYKDYCDHIASGKSHKSWYYDKDGLLLTWVSIETYIKNDEDLDPLYKQIAISKSLDIWESLGKDMMLGQYEKCQPAIFQMFMRNKFQYDRKEEPTENKPQAPVQVVDYAKAEE